MKPKGKYKLYSYVIENNLIFYNSVNKKKKLIAFSIMYVKNLQQLISILQDFLKKNILNYFSLQIHNKNYNHILLFLNFEDMSKKNILKCYNIVLQEIRDYIDKINKKDIEKIFFNIGIKELSPNQKIRRKSGKILLEHQDISNYIRIFKINLPPNKKQENFLKDFLIFTKDLNYYGYLVITFNSDSISIVFILINRENRKNNKKEFDKEINEIYKFILLQELTPNYNIFFKLLWRHSFSNSTISSDDFNFLFLEEKSYNIEDIISQLEMLLTENKIIFKKINKNLILINQKYLFFIFKDIDFKIIIRIFKKFYSKYYIYILLPDNQKFENLIKIKKINLLNKVKILNPKKFNTINVKEFI